MDGDDALVAEKGRKLYQGVHRSEGKQGDNMVVPDHERNGGDGEVAVVHRGVRKIDNDVRGKERSWEGRGRKKGLTAGLLEEPRLAGEEDDSDTASWTATANCVCAGTTACAGTFSSSLPVQDDEGVQCSFPGATERSGSMWFAGAAR
jgi:hypothetical protein